MSLWSRARARARALVEAAARRFTEPREPSPPREPPREPEREPGIRGEPGEPAESRLPPGWVLVGLYHQGEKTEKIHATNDTEATDSEIQRADAIIVHYVDGGEDGYKWIHGATGWDSIADQIERTIKPTSPKGTGQ